MKRISLLVIFVLTACLVEPVSARQEPGPQPGAQAGAQGAARPVPKVTINTAGAPLLGSEDAKITVVVFSDFQ